MIRIDIQSRIMSKNARLGFFSPKYKALHRMFKKKFRQYMLVIFLLSYSPAFVHEKYNDKNMRKKIIVHAIGKT